ncbi:MAG: CPBP family intramembrane metalloprotease, partial [Planctomycetaceae bacterium]|nr:CPBP family intramembrane metalloprotease [Planctomycetaceae bacterium]
ICPASRVEIVLGKFFTVMLFSISTAVLNLFSMGFTGRYLATMGGNGTLSRIGNISPPSLSAMVWVVVLLVPLAALFSALCLSLATFARSSKEGQYYLTPLLMVTLGLTVFCLSPGVEISAFYSLMPVVGVALLLKKILATSGGTEALIYTVPVLVTSIGYSLLALWWAIEQFRREDVLFREAEQFDLRLWLRHLLRDKEATPSFAEAGFCFVLIMLLQFGAMRFMGDALRTAGEGAATAQSMEMVRLLIIQQIALVASPALFMAIMLTTSVRKTLRLQFPGWQMLAVAVALPLALNPLAVELVSSLKWFFPPLPEGAARAMAAMSSDDLPLWLVLLAFSVAPAVCEEITFRGFLLSGFGESKRMWLAIVLSSVAFGVIHMIPQQVFNATLLGLVLGLLAIRSGSLLPCIVFHLIFNGLEVLKGRFAVELTEKLDLTWILTATPEGLHYTWQALVLAAVASIALLVWLVNHGKSLQEPDPSEPAFLGNPASPNAIVQS